MCDMQSFAYEVITFTNWNFNVVILMGCLFMKFFCWYNGRTTDGWLRFSGIPAQAVQALPLSDFEQLRLFLHRQHIINTGLHGFSIQRDFFYSRE